jgi:catechol-2,3-dioxygenase
MIRVSKIARPVRTPDLSQQTEYYTEIIGLTLAAQEKTRSISLDRGSSRRRSAQGSQAQCTRIGFQIPPSADLDEFKTGGEPRHRH